MKFPKNTDWHILQFDDIVPAFRERRFDLPPWGYELATALAEYKERNGSPFGVTTSNGLYCSHREISAALFAAILTAWIPAMAPVAEAQQAVDRAARLLVDKPGDPNAVLLELNAAFGLLETFLTTPVSRACPVEVQP